MGWISTLLNRVAGAAPTQWSHVTTLSTPPGPAIAPDECYLELYLDSLRLARARRFATRYNAVAYSYLTLARDGAATATLAAVSKPQNLSELDAGALDRVITLSKRMAGPVPWRGGALGLELGLFSVKSGDLMGPMVDYVARVATAAGVGFVTQAAPFLPLIQAGMDLMTGQGSDAEIEIALDTDMTLDAPYRGAVIAAAAGSLDPARLDFDPATGTLSHMGRPLDAGYCVYSIRASRQRADWGDIPDLRAAYATLHAAILANRIADAKDALATFRRACALSPDLIPADAKRLIAKAESAMTLAFPGGGIAAPATRAQIPATLDQVALYD